MKCKGQQHEGLKQRTCVVLPKGTGTLEPLLAPGKDVIREMLICVSMGIALVSHYVGYIATLTVHTASVPGFSGSLLATPRWKPSKVIRDWDVHC